ncbi:MAG TPA: glycoside hydrolase family 3 C-terminal domain-containing protein [Firmicutes bacterium]|nr:glycoside hydrolase family 3 C-terminal domain-containing protein [Bacillota bacterium]
MFLFRNKNTLVWFIVTVALVVIFTVVTILSATVFYKTFNTVLPGGGERAVYADGIEPRYVSDYENKEAALAGANEFNVELNEEGIVLLKNESNALPIYTPLSPETVAVSEKPKVSIFGKNSVNIVRGGSGSGGASSDAGTVDIYAALESAGYETNPILKDFYSDDGASGEKRPARPPNTNLDDGKSVRIATYETPQSMYTQSVKDSYDDYNDVALVVISRMGGEGYDLGRSMEDMPGARNADDHYLQLDQNETDLLAAVCGSFDKVVVVINSGSAMELGFLEDENHYAYHENIEAALWIGFPGNSGLTALGRVLNGSVNPSGRTVDTYAADFKQDPSWGNFGDNLAANGNRYRVGEEWQNYYSVSYEENIYVGYRYYETRGFIDGEEWYDDNVVYPFGYGLSYTDFAWELTDKSSLDGKTITKDEKYTIEVTVTNEGDVSGKEVVQVYASAPYTAGKIEKAHKTLIGFAKTELLAPGDSEAVQIEIDPYYIASYDYDDANGSNFCGYELDGGEYKLYIGKNAHDETAEITFSVASSGIRYDKDPVTQNDVVNRYTDQDNEYFNSDYQLTDIMSRENFELPVAPTLEERTVTSAFIRALADMSHNNPNDYSSEAMPWSDEPMGMTLRDMLVDDEGSEFDIVPYDDVRWENLLDQANLSEMLYMVTYGAFATERMDSIGKPKTNDTDGPAGFVNFLNPDIFYGTCYYASQVVVASTWNAELVREFGISVGNEGIIGNENGDKMPYSGWYAPGVNIHRSPFGGRNFEYFSEDPFLTGKLAAAQIQGAQSKGVYCFIKHFALNEQETHRSISGLVTWATEQSMRELYLRPFEMAVKEGGTRAIMSSFNRIGTRWTGGDYRLLTEILRDEWGFRGTVICDFNTVSYIDCEQMAYAGGDLNLMMTGSGWKCDFSDTSDVIVLRQCVKNILYTVVNSNAMNGEIIGYKMPIWQIVLIVIDCVIVAGIAVWGFFAIRKALKKNK